VCGFEGLASETLCVFDWCWNLGFSHVFDNSKRCGYRIEGMVFDAVVYHNFFI
jgi:hypothetical protein